MSKLSQMIPIRKGEIAKFFLTSSMMVLTLYIYSILRNTKDTLVMSEMGAEMISALKMCAVLPSSILFMLFYTKLVDLFSRTRIYHMLNFFFLGYFLLFDLVLYPNASHLHFHTGIAESYPQLKYMALIFENWSYSLFYILSELWGSVMLSLMFWQLANQINSIDEAKRFYPLIGLIGQIGLISAGLIAQFSSTISGDNWHIALHYICASVIVCGAALSFALYYLGHFVVSPEIINGESKKKKKEKMGLVASLKYIIESRYIRLITLLILCYGSSINLVEGVWKASVKALFSNKADITHFMGSVQTWTGVASLIMMLTGSVVLRMFSWRFNALATPVILLLTGVPFFLFAIYQTSVADFFAIAPADILWTAVFFGAAQNVLSKAVKYSFFDPTKEMSYIPLDEDLKAKGKAAADVIGGRLGKSGGALVTVVLLTLTGSSLLSLAPVFNIIFLVLMVIWIYAVVALSKEFNKMRGQA